MKDLDLFWKGELLGITFVGEEVNKNGASYCINQNTPIYILGEKSSKVNFASEFMTNRGFNVIEARTIVADSSDDGLALFDSVDSKEDFAIILADKSIYNNHLDIWKTYVNRILYFDKIRIFYSVFLPQLREVYSMLEDEFSKDTYTASLCHRFKIYGRRVLYPYICDKQYFCIPQQRVLNRNEVFVDCGAFVGDTIESLLRERSGLVKKIYSFEPFDDAFKSLSIRCNRLKTDWMLGEDAIVLEKGGVGSKRCRMKLYLNGSNLGSQLKDIGDMDNNDADENDIDVYSLDEYFENQYVSFIKADIEGMEMEMLRGAQNVIKRDKPNLAICIYHKLTDYYEIPLFIKGLVPEYKMAIRHHSSFIEETVLYCYIDNGL